MNMIEMSSPPLREPSQPYFHEIKGGQRRSKGQRKSQMKSQISQIRFVSNFMDHPFFSVTLSLVGKSKVVNFLTFTRVRPSFI